MAESIVNFEVYINLDPNWKELHERLEEVVEIAARNVETHSKLLVPVDTGATKNSIQSFRVGNLALGSIPPRFDNYAQSNFQSNQDNISWRIGPSTWYAPLLEYGTTGMPARPYMRPAAAFEEPRLKRAIEIICRNLS